MQKLIVILAISILVAGTLFGCARAVLKMEKSVAAFMADDTLSVDCKAGIAQAAILAPDTGADVRIAAEAVGKYANKDSEEYKRCYTKAAFVSFTIRGGLDEVSKITTNLMTLGILP